VPPAFWKPGRAGALIAAESLSVTGNDSTTGPSSGTTFRQSVDSRRSSLSSNFTTGFSGTDSQTDSSDTLCNLFTTPIAHGTSATPDDIGDDAWDEPNQRDTRASSVTTTGHNYVIVSGENSLSGRRDSNPRRPAWESSRAVS
jgi:hypothetical protein